MTRSPKKNEAASDFENLVRNGIDFLEKAMSQLDSDPKYSVINFYTAVEIFLKAPLVREHWSLVVVDRDPNRQKYEAGDFISVSFDDACSRLSLSLKKPLAKSAKEVFDKVRRHRNRMVHFYHSGISGKQQRDDIKLEQAQAWFELNRFVTDTWSDEFEPFIQEFKRMERSLIANNHYAQAKYESLKTKIEGMKAGGAIFADCPRCRTSGCQVYEEAERLTSYHCVVCFYNDSRLQVTCPSCGDSDQHMTPYEGFICEKCDHSVSGENRIFSFLDQSKTRYTKDDFDSNTPANCDECQSYHSVCEYGDGYLCTNCLTFFDSINNCEWCNDPMTGSAGHHADD
jgi:hypothetical protein